MLTSGSRSLVILDSTHLEHDGEKFQVLPSMLVLAEVNLGRRTVMEYLLLPEEDVA